MGRTKYEVRRGRLMRPPRPLADLRESVLARERQMTRERGQAPTLAEVAASLGVELDTVVEAMAAGEACALRSLNNAMTGLEHDPSGTLEESLGREDPDLARVETRVAWDQVMDGLEPNLKQVLELRFYGDLSQKEAARRLGVSQMQVSRLERRAIEHLRDRAGEAIRAM
jgi:RNA polymerase sigma factor (sigma-70 family)